MKKIIKAVKYLDQGVLTYDVMSKKCNRDSFFADVDATKNVESFRIN